MDTETHRRIRRIARCLNLTPAEVVYRTRGDTESVRRWERLLILAGRLDAPPAAKLASPPVKDGRTWTERLCSWLRSRLGSSSGSPPKSSAADGPSAGRPS